MEKNPGNRIWLWLVLLLVACNIALIATIWLRPTAAGDLRMPPPPHGGLGADFNKQLSFTPAQNEKFMQMRAVNQRKIDSLKQLAKNTREHFFSGLKTAAGDPQQRDSIAGILGSYHKSIELQTYSHLAEVRGMLSEQQKLTFDDIIIDVLRHMPEQPRFKGDGIRPHRMDEEHEPPPPGERSDPPPPPPREEEYR